MQETRMRGAHRDVRIRVVGVGRGGACALDRLRSADAPGVELAAVDTDLLALDRCSTGIRVGIGIIRTRGLGAGGAWTAGREAAEESRERLADLVSGADLVFVTAGLGGGAGTGASAIVAELAR